MMRRGKGSSRLTNDGKHRTVLLSEISVCLFMLLRFRACAYWPSQGKKRARALAQQAGSASTNVPHRQHGRPDTPAETQEDHPDEETPKLSPTFVLFSKSVLQNLTFSPSSLSSQDPKSAYIDQFVMPPNPFAAPYSTYHSFAEFTFLAAQDQEMRLSSSSHQDQHHQAMPLQHTAMRERYKSHSPEVSLHVPYGSSVLPEPFLSGPLVQDGEAARMIYCMCCRAVLEAFGQCQNPCRSAAIKVLRLNNTDLHPLE